MGRYVTGGILAECYVVHENPRGTCVSHGDTCDEGYAKNNTNIS